MRTYIITGYHAFNAGHTKQIIRAINREFAINLFQIHAQQCIRFDVKEI